MHNSHDQPLRLVDEPLDEPNATLDGLRTRLADVRDRIDATEREIATVSEKEQELTRQLATRRARLGTLYQQLHEAQQEAATLMATEMTAARDTMLGEATEVLEEARADAEREATRITDRAFEDAEETIAGARAESDQILASGQERLAALEAEAIDRAAILDDEHRDLSNRLKVMQTIYDELQETLQMVAETSVQELTEMRAALTQIPESDGADPSTVQSESASPDETIALDDTDASHQIHHDAVVPLGHGGDIEISTLGDGD